MTDTTEIQSPSGGSQLKTAVIFGVISAFSSFVLFLILYIMDVNPVSGPATWLGLWIPVLFIYLGIKQDRDNNLEGYISFGRGLGTGMLVTLTAATLYSALIFLFGKYLAPSIIDTIREEALRGMEKAKEFISLEMYEQSLTQIANMGMGQVAFGDWQKTILGGLIVSLIVAGILKRKRPLFDSSEPAN